MTVSNVIEEFYNVSDDGFLKIALKYGNPIKSRPDSGIIDTLITRTSDQVERDSLTKRYGAENFPIHTDCAYLKTPPRFILLKYVGDITEVTPTVIVHFDINRLTEEEIDFIKHRIWFVKGENKGFYSRILQNGILRYDKEVMKLVNSDSDLMETILKKMTTTSISWEKNKVAIIDNYAVLHYRPKVSEKEINKRILQRINII
jgi:hypothetical protein